MSKEKVCGACKWHIMETKIVGAKDIYSVKISSQVVNEWFCNNSRSEYYTDFTDYSDTCDEYER